MTNVEDRVSQCFLNVFPDLSEADLATATQATLPEWDSLAHVTLLSAISEEFQLDTDFESFEALTSYPLVLAFVEEQQTAK